MYNDNKEILKKISLRELLQTASTMDPRTAEWVRFRWVDPDDVASPLSGADPGVEGCPLFSKEGEMRSVKINGVWMWNFEGVLLPVI